MIARLLRTNIVFFISISILIFLNFFLAFCDPTTFIK